MKIYEYSLKAVCVREDAPEVTVSRADAVREYMRGAFDTYPEQEQFWVLFLNRKNVIKGRLMLTLGTQTAALVAPREVLRAAIMANSCGFICVHNHPSGDPAPSSADLQITRMIREAAKAVELAFLDHVILGETVSDPLGRGLFSFQEAGLL